MKLEHSLTPNPKINSKWIRHLNVRPNTIKLLEENIGRTLFDINHSKIFFNPHPRVMEIKTVDKTMALLNELYPDVEVMGLYDSISDAADRKSVV